MEAFVAQHPVFAIVCAWAVFLLGVFAFVDFFVAAHRTDLKRLKRDVYLWLFVLVLAVLLLLAPCN